MASRGWAQGEVPLTNLTPIAPPSLPPAPSGYNSPLLDAYNSGPGAGAYAPAVPGVAPQPSSTEFPGWLPRGAAPPTFGPGNPGFSTEGMGYPGLGQTAYGAPPSSYSPYGAQPYASQPYMNPGLPPPAFPPEAYPSNIPQTLFPGGVYGGGSLLPSSPLGNFGVMRLFQGPRLRHGWLRGGDGDKSVQINETDASLVFACPNFLYSGQPIYLAPSFGLTLFDGPHSSTGADLPGQAYSAFMDTAWQSDPNQMLSVDLGLRLGVFSDFDAHSSDSFRVLARGLGHFRLSPYSTFKAGVYYLDRDRVQWLPAVGILYQPTPTKRYDLFFPEPKISRYLTTLGTQDLWGYVAGEYGGGSWTMRRENGDDDLVDINDIRVLLGLEWGRNDLIRQGRRTGFFEAGYVFSREIKYKRNRGDNLDLNDTIMLRLGIGY